MSSKVILEFIVGARVRVKPLPHYHYGGGIKPGVVCVVEEVDDYENTQSYRLRAESGVGGTCWYRPEEVERAERRQVEFKDVPPASVFYTHTGGVYVACVPEATRNALCIVASNIARAVQSGYLATFSSTTRVFLDP